MVVCLIDPNQSGAVGLRQLGEIAFLVQDLNANVFAVFTVRFLHWFKGFDPSARWPRPMT